MSSRQARRCEVEKAWQGRGSSDPDAKKGSDEMMAFYSSSSMQELFTLRPSPFSQHP